MSCTYNLRPADPFYQGLVNRVTAKLNMPRIEVFEADTANACATLFKRSLHDNRKPIITYNPVFMQEVYEHNPWAAYFIMIHEVAHHYNRDLHGRFLSALHGIDHRSHQKELNADYVAGWMLYCEGASLNDTLSLAGVIDLVRSNSHPGEAQRKAAMKKGWSDADCRYVPAPKIVRKPKVAIGEIFVGAAAVALIFAGINALAGNK